MINGYSKPIINPYKNTVPVTKKENKVESVNTPNTTEPTTDSIANNLDMPFNGLPEEYITTDHPAEVNHIGIDNSNIEIKSTNTEITKEEINHIDDVVDAIAEEAAKNAEENEDIEHIRELQHKEYEDRDIAELTPEDAIHDETLPEGVVAAERSFAMDASGKPIFTKEVVDTAPASDVDILHVDDLDEFNKSQFDKNFMETTAKLHQISDEDALALLDIMTAYKKDKSMSIYNKLPEGIKTQVKQICMSANIPMSNANQVAKMMLEEMIAETATDQTFIDFEKSINEAMKIPSMVDLYEEHVGETMSEKLPAMAAAIEKEDPEKAKQLLAIADQYEAARTYSKLKDFFDNNSRVRKLMRRDWEKIKKFADECNFQNENSNFRIPDATTLYPILTKVITNDSDNDITDKQVKKFLVLLFYSITNLHKDELIDAAYIYYLLKNITMLNYMNDSSAKTANTFSVELISNIKALIYYITAKEEEFYASNQSSGSRK